MRTITPEPFELFTLAELEPSARGKAIAAIAERLSGAWWDSHDNDDISDVIRYALACEFGTPGHDAYGEGDFPGIPGVKLDGWSLDRGSCVVLTGTLTRDNAPRLPWVEGLVEVSLTAGRDSTSIVAEFDDVLTADDIELASDAMECAVRDAMHAALSSGRDEMEYKTGPEYAESLIEDNGYEFLADGTPWFG